MHVLLCVANKGRRPRQAHLWLFVSAPVIGASYGYEVKFKVQVSVGFPDSRIQGYIDLT